MRNDSVTYELYADVVLVNNFTMDFLLLAAVRRMMKLEVRKGGLFTASMAGALFALAVMIVPLPVFFLSSALGSIGMSLVMVLLAFRLRSLVELFRALGGLYLSSAMAAGMMELLRPLDVFFSVWGFGTAGLLSVGGSCFLWKQMSCQAVRNGHLYAVDLYFGEKKRTVTALLDTGNHLTEPISGKPVSVLWGEAAEGLYDGAAGVFCIPFRTVGEEDGLLYAVRGDRMEIQMDGWRKRIEHPYIAISQQPLSQNDSYQMLLNEKLWTLE